MADRSYFNHRVNHEAMNRRSSEGNLLDNLNSTGQRQMQRTMGSSADSSPGNKRRPTKQAYLPLHGNTLLRLVTANENLSVETHPENRDSNETLPISNSRISLYGTLPRSGVPQFTGTKSRTSLEMSSPIFESPESAIPRCKSNAGTWSCPSNSRRRSEGTMASLFGKVVETSVKEGSVESLDGTSPKQEEISFDESKEDADSGFGQTPSECENDEMTRL